MMGFTVLQAADGIEAVETLREHAREIVCALLDMTMPRMSGEETLRAIRQAAPSLPIVVMSGYSEQETMGRLGETGVAGFVQKPFTLADLQEAVAAAVAGGELVTIA
jgi:CheY-like chemotaxis protein